MLQKNLLKNDPFPSILGQENAKKALISTLLSQRNVVIVGPPGVGKTTIAKDVAALLPGLNVMACPFHCLPEKPLCPECRNKKTNGKKEITGKERFVRIQGSPDLTAEDLIGDIDPGKAMKHGSLSLDAFVPGKIFKANQGVLFFDELNRCPERLQNALLQSLEERKVTIGSYDIDFSADFIFIATMNPQDQTTEPLSEVLLDRFDVVEMGYPETIEIEQKIVVQKGKQLEVEFPESLLTKTISFVQNLRRSKELEKVPGVRASLGLYERAQATAVSRGSNIVTNKDVAVNLLSVLAHRIKLKPSAAYLQSPEQFLKEKIEKEFSSGKDSENSDGP